LKNSLKTLKDVWPQKHAQKNLEWLRLQEESHAKFLEDVHMEILAQQDRDSQKGLSFLLCIHRYPNANPYFLEKTLVDSGFILLASNSGMPTRNLSECTEADAADACKPPRVPSIRIENTWKNISKAQEIEKTSTPLQL
jgi:hypothetical protein